MTNQLTAAEARAWMAQGPQYRVRDKDAAKYAMRDGTLFRRFRDGWDGISDACFDDAAHFTPYTKVSKCELRYEAATARNLASMAQGLMEAHRERAERAEARAKELEAYASSLVAQRNDYCAQRDACARQKVELLAEMDKIVEDRDGLAHSLGYAEATINVLTAERDAAPGKETP